MWTIVAGQCAAGTHRRARSLSLPPGVGRFRPLPRCGDGAQPPRGKGAGAGGYLGVAVPVDPRHFRLQATVRVFEADGAWEAH